MIKAGADVNLAKVEKVTPVIAASYGDNVELVKRLLAAGRGNAAALDALLAAGVDVNARFAHQLMLLMWTAGQGQAAVVTLLLERGADAALRDGRGVTTLDIAQSAGKGVVAQTAGLH